MTDVFQLIEEAMRGVRVVPCGRCEGTGSVGLSSLRATCPDCRGAGRTTANDREDGES